MGYYLIKVLVIIYFLTPNLIFIDKRAPLMGLNTATFAL